MMSEITNVLADRIISHDKAEKWLKMNINEINMLRSIHWQETRQRHNMEEVQPVTRREMKRIWGLWGVSTVRAKEL